MEEGVLWRADVMKGSCTVARGERHQHALLTFMAKPAVCGPVVY
jgi:hypothetical protein